MAKITVVFEDMKDGTAKIVCRPKLEQIVEENMKAGRKTFTPAQAYVFKAMHACREASKRLDKLGKSPLIRSVFGG